MLLWSYIHTLHTYGPARFGFSSGRLVGTCKTFLKSLTETKIMDLSIVVVVVLCTL
jgi:hypothetical protein